ncbi:MAG: outer rane lipoprotein chaperone LolA [Pseudomonadota bacterium]|jgi:outer membrane lipoprotein carrier protein
MSVHERRRALGRLLSGMVAPQAGRWLSAGGLGALALATGPVQAADALATLRQFNQEVRSARARFTQTVTSPDGARRKTSSGRFEFMRPDRFRFVYEKPFEQLIVADGRKVWLHDPDLNQVTVRAMDQALGATPAALLAGNQIERDFELKALPARDGLDWVQALPRGKDGQLRQLAVGFRGTALAALEIVDAFGQRSLLQFSELQTNVAFADDAFRFTPPKGADLVSP